MIEYIILGVLVWLAIGYILYWWSYEWELDTAEEIKIGLMVMFGGPFNIIQALKIRKLSKHLNDL